MTSHPPPVPLALPGFVVVDVGLPDRPPLGRAEDFDAALYVLAGLQEEFYDQLDANGEGGCGSQLALAIAPVDAGGNIERPCFWSIVNGLRPAER